MDLSIVIPALNEGENLKTLLPEIRKSIAALALESEILVVTQDRDPLTDEAAAASGARVIKQVERGYGGALLAGFATAGGAYILTMDADFSHQPSFIRDLWAARDRAEVTIASRYCPGGSARMPLGRFLLSRVLNVVFGRGLSLATRDFSSGFRLYKSPVVRDESFESCDFNILQEILVRAYARGWRVAEVPFAYTPRRHGSSNARIIRFGLAYMRTFLKLWKYRNSIQSADYDDRAYNSPIVFQRLWQRKRCRHVGDLIAGQGRVLDVGCGSSRIIGLLPPGSVALDILLPKLRYSRKFSQWLVRGSALQLPFRDGLFPCVLCSEVIEHLPRESAVLAELERVLAPGGRLVLGTPDYGRWEWRAIERIYEKVVPGGYAEEHVGHYTKGDLIRHFQARGYVHEETRTIFRGEMILAFRKKG
ncbi:MAG: glycosyltransferase [Candidatus Aminicenantes bacterium]|nr:glycosyltransferase [Candidatus Aminicenantes bacterium]